MYKSNEHCISFNCRMFRCIFISRKPTAHLIMDCSVSIPQPQRHRSLLTEAGVRIVAIRWNRSENRCNTEPANTDFDSLFLFPFLRTLLDTNRRLRFVRTVWFASSV